MRLTFSSQQILELQQQLAVSVSTDRKKDMMIEQLDKVRLFESSAHGHPHSFCHHVNSYPIFIQTLAKLVEGWQRKDAEKEERLRMLAAENAQLNIKDDQQSKVSLLPHLHRLQGILKRFAASATE